MPVAWYTSTDLAYWSSWKLQLRSTNLPASSQRVVVVLRGREEGPAHWGVQHTGQVAQYNIFKHLYSQIMQFWLAGK